MELTEGNLYDQFNKKGDKRKQEEDKGK